MLQKGNCTCELAIIICVACDMHKKAISTATRARILTNQQNLHRNMITRGNKSAHLSLRALISFARMCPCFAYSISFSAKMLMSRLAVTSAAAKLLFSACRSAASL
jgi:hypothetical protein